MICFYVMFTSAAFKNLNFNTHIFYVPARTRRCTTSKACTWATSQRTAKSKTVCMYTCMYTCMYVYKRVFICIYVYLYVCTCMYVYIYVPEDGQVQNGVNVYGYVCAYTCMCMYIRVCMCIYTSREMAKSKIL